MSSLLASFRHGAAPRAPGTAAWARLRLATEVGREVAHRYLLLLRLLLANLVGGAMLALAYWQGWIDQVRAADDTNICKLIACLFLVGLAWTGRRALMI